MDKATNYELSGLQLARDGIFSFIIHPYVLLWSAPRTIWRMVNHNSDKLDESLIKIHALAATTVIADLCLLASLFIFMNPGGIFLVLMVRFALTIAELIMTSVLAAEEDGRYTTGPFDE